MKGLGLLCLMLGLVMTLSWPVRPMEQRTEGQLEITTHHPEDTPLGTVVCLHSFFQSQENGWVVAQAMARAGFLALNVKLPGGWEFEQYVRQLRPLIVGLPQPVRLWGHSMGADLAVNLADEIPMINSTVAAGFPVVASHPRGLILQVGLWDQLHSVAEMQQAAQEAGTLCQVLVLADHHQEGYDPEGFWLAARQFGSRASLTEMGDPQLGRALIAFGAMLLAFAFKGGQSRKGTAVLAAVAGLFWQLDPFHACSRALLAATIVGQSRPLQPARPLLPAAYLAYASGVLVNAWPNWISRPGRLGYFPLHAGLSLAYNWQQLAALISFPVLVLGFALELAWPGRIGRTLAFIPGQVWDRIATAKISLSLQIDRRSLAALSFLAIVAAFQWRQVVGAGYALDLAQALLLGQKLLALVVVPILTFGLAVRLHSSGIRGPLARK